MSKEHTIPEFRSEAEEAQWWDDHREETAEWVEDAAAAGKTTTLSQVLEKARQRSASTPTVSIRIDPNDQSRARALAQKRGLRYSTYLGILLHEALDREEKASTRL